MNKDRFDNAELVHSDEELQKRVHNDNYQLIKEGKQRLLSKILYLLYLVMFLVALALIGYTMYIFGCPLIKPKTGEILQDIVNGLFAWLFGAISHYSFNKWRKISKN